MKANNNFYINLTDYKVNIPLFKGDPVSFSLLEVGCKASGKVSQLVNKRELFYDYWDEFYSENIGFRPAVYRMLAHYDPQGLTRTLQNYNHDIDVVINYSYIPKDALLMLDEEDKKEIYRAANSTESTKARLEEIIEDSDAEQLHSMIVKRIQDNEISLIKGKVAEIIVQKDIQAWISDDMKFYNNGFIKHINDRYISGTEIDGLLAFYGKDSYINLIERIREVDHIKVLDIWHD